MGYFKSYLFLLVIVLLFALFQSIVVLMREPSWVMKGIAAIVLVTVIYLGSFRNTYLPFLGPTVLPQSLLKEPGKVAKTGATHVTLFANVPDNTKVIYWAAKSSQDIIFEDPYVAYEDYTNAGVTLVKNKQANLIIDCPSSYKIPSGKTLSPHVHYRIVYPNGILGSVQTLYVKC